MAKNKNGVMKPNGVEIGWNAYLSHTMTCKGKSGQCTATVEWTAESAKDDIGKDRLASYDASSFGAAGTLKAQVRMDPKKPVIELKGKCRKNGIKKYQDSCTVRRTLKPKIYVWLALPPNMVADEKAWIEKIEIPIVLKPTISCGKPKLQIVETLTLKGKLRRNRDDTLRLGIPGRGDRKGDGGK